MDECGVDKESRKAVMSSVERDRFCLYTRQELIESGVLTIHVEELARFLSIGRTAAYACVRRGEIPCLRLGRKLVIPVSALLRKLGEAE